MQLPFEFLSSYNITITQMDASKRGLTHSKSPFSTSRESQNGGIS